MIKKPNKEDVICGGLAQIPPRSRLYEAVMELLQNYKSGASCKDSFAGIFAKYDDCDIHHSLHTISNALIVVAALLYGDGDYGRSVCLAVEAGFDTDCNGATVGSIVGMMKGIDAIGEEWKNSIQGKVATSIFGLETVEVSNFVENTMKHVEVKA